jgi:hypothetical protein
MCDLEPPVVVQRYEHAAPGDLLHLDIKRLVRIARPSHRVTGDRRDTVKGIAAEYVHVAVDDILLPSEDPLSRGTYRQWRKLPLVRLRRRLPEARPQAPPNKTLHAPHQR